MGAAGRARVQAHFNEDVVARQTLDIYRSASERAGQPCPLIAAGLPPSGKSSSSRRMSRPRRAPLRPARDEGRGHFSGRHIQCLLGHSGPWIEKPDQAAHNRFYAREPLAAPRSPLASSSP